jgi:hypothetical protein
VSTILLCLSASQGYGTIVSLHNSGGELCLYTIQGENCFSTQFRGRIVSPYNLGVLHVDLQGGTIVSLHNSGGELSLYTIQGGNCVLKIWVPAALLFPGMC